MGVDVSHDNVVTTGFEELIESWCKISGWTGGVKEDVNVDVIDDGCDGEVCSCCCRGRENRYGSGWRDGVVK